MQHMVQQFESMDKVVQQFGGMDKAVQPVVHQFGAYIGVDLWPHTLHMPNKTVISNHMFNNQYFKWTNALLRTEYSARVSNVGNK
ncbi:hypothetical protein L195_g012212 [Trifolium pratense]|uniref:Uncharacterized protein n=1 Tax=Trifolium pratense TaxID=57577 RepID=A0A2K3PJS6_TRIPR|nr:hypothetical protein L195_g012212 [Trifolium pratense]